jgi:SAM-dependent methyltransferase
MSAVPKEFCRDYALHRADEGYAFRGENLMALPYLRTGPLARQWAVRAATFDAFVAHIAKPMLRSGPKDILDLGAGNGWLCNRVAQMGHRAVALDIRDDDIDGLAAAREFLSAKPGSFQCICACFEDLPFERACFDVALFNASLHYARDLRRALTEAIRVTRSRGVLAILDSPFYARERDGELMVAEKIATGAMRFGCRADVLLTQNFIEYLTPEKLCAASTNLSWVRHRVHYPLWYQLRPAIAWLKGKRKPSRFDLWTARVP